MSTPMLFRILPPQPGLALQGSATITTPSNIDAALAMACLAARIDKEVYRTTIAAAIVPDYANEIESWLKSPANKSRVSNAVGWCRSKIPNGRERIPDKDRDAGQPMYYRLRGARDEVDAYVLLQDKGDADDALRIGDFSTAVAAAGHGLALWSGPLKHRFFEQTTFGGQLADRLTKSMEHLIDAYADAVIGLAGESGSPDGVAQKHLSYLEWMLTERPEFHDDIVVNLARIYRAIGNEREAARLAPPEPIEVTRPEGKERPLPAETSSVDPDSLSRVSPAHLQVALAQLDPQNRSQAALMDMLSTTTIHPNFRLFVVSGVSAAGKDSLVAAARNDATIAQQFEMLTKYTTRKARNNEAGYSKSVGWPELLQLVEGDKLAFAYEKRREYYGFDLQQLRRAMAEGTKLVAIFTEFDQVPEVRRILRLSGALAVPILIEADLNTMVRRTRMRPFSREEQEERIDSAREDLDRIRMRDIGSEYVIIPHTNRHAFDSALERIKLVLDGNEPAAEPFLT